MFISRLRTISSHFQRSAVGSEFNDQHTVTEQDSESPKSDTRWGPNNDMTLKEFQDLIDSEPRIAYIAGYQDISRGEFIEHYIEELDKGIERGDPFIVSDEPGTSVMALEYLHEKNVPAEKITVYHCTNLPACERITELRAGNWKGCKVKTIPGGEMERIRAMSKDSEYNIVWIRPHDEIKGVKTASDVLNERYTGLNEIKRLRSERGILKFMEEYDKVV